MNEAEKKNLYPEEETPLREHYSNYDNVYVGLLPFIKLEKENNKASSSKKVISLKEAQEKDDILKELKDYSNMTIYSSNDDYPSDEEIIEKGQPILWKEIINNTKIEDERALNKALMTSIGAYHKKLRRQDFLNYLNDYSEKNDIWHPTEGSFGYFTKISIYRTLREAGINSVEIVDEFYEEKKSLKLSDLTESEFCNKVGFKDYYIYTKDKSILFSIGWDFFFYFIAIKEDTFSKQLIENHFEGFWASKKDSHLWTWEEGEIDRLMNEKKNKEKKENWWQQWLKRS